MFSVEIFSFSNIVKTRTKVVPKNVSQGFNKGKLVPIRSNLKKKVLPKKSLFSNMKMTL